MNPAVMTTRDPNLPAEYSAGLDRLSLAPLWTALHALLPQERVSRAMRRKRVTRRADLVKWRG